MTRYELSTKMLLANFRRYRLYFACNVFSVVVFYCFASLFTNRYFMDRDIVSANISSNIFAPSLFAGVFVALFIPYSFGAFMKKRKHEYGILMTLGMSETEVLGSMLAENSTVAALSLIAALLLGTVLSLGFFFIVRRVIGVTGLRWYLNPGSYLWTAALYAAAVALTLLTGIFGFMKTQVTDLLKEKFRGEKVGKPLPGLFPAGLVLILLAAIIGLRLGNSDFLLASMALLFAGLWVAASGIGKGRLFRAQSSVARKDILGYSFTRQHHSSQRKIAVIAAWMIGFSIFFGGLGLVMYPSLTRNAVLSNPYDLSYSEIFGMNRVEDRTIINLLSRNGVAVQSEKQVPYLRSRAFTVLPVSEVNGKLGGRYEIPQGRFVMLFQYVNGDGYEHDTSSPEFIPFRCGSEDLLLKSAGTSVRILFNDNPTLADYTLIVSDSDYQKIASECRDCWAGKMKLFTFKNWRNSQKGTDAVQQELLKANHLNPADQKKYYSATTRLDSYTNAIQSSEFYLFLMGFILVLFSAAADIMVHFKIKAESEEEQRMLSGLSRIGVTPEEIRQMIRYKDFAYHMPQVLTGAAIGVFYNFAVNRFYGWEWKAAGSSLLIGLVLAAVQWLYTMRYSAVEFRHCGA